ncbi:hypothetical protein KI688_003428 [Linnemannia hyalina]|uniref:Zn(2)-C6 fungal-type domain-containing protein n=1 Tax=Linnemannia hyalina TaxID=64524 RepID=A0A9P8BQD0_9FUNG|nr:hypothetical protein KI688_003428 [Linnemannia hyalina]
MPMQVFEFHADATVSLASTAAINRKSCDHCFLNRKTCDKVRHPTADPGDKCKRCAKDDRPCTFTPTVHLYHIADCVGRHQCRAKVVQAMGGRKKEIKFKTIEIPIICDMDSELDQALYEYIQKQPNLLVYNNRIKSFLAQDMLGLTEEQEDLMSVQNNNNDQDVPDVTSSPSSESPSHGAKRSFEPEDGSSKDMNLDNTAGSPTQGPQKYRIMALIDAHQSQTPQQQQQQLQLQLQQQQQALSRHQKRPSEDQGRNVPTSMPSPTPLSPTDVIEYHKRRESALLALPSVATFGSLYQSDVQQQPQHQQQQQNLYVHQNVLTPINTNFGQQQSLQAGYRSTSPLLHSPSGHSPTQHSPHPPSPLELSLDIKTNFGALSGSHHNLPSLFDTSLSMSTQLHEQQQQQQQQPMRTSVGTSTSPQMGSDADFSAVPNPVGPPPPLVIKTTNEDGNEVGFYYAVPEVNLNPAFSDADLFQDFTMMDALGEDFVWIENLFDEPTPEEAAATMTAMSVAAAAGRTSSTADHGVSTNAALGAMESLMNAASTTAGSDDVPMESSMMVGSMQGLGMPQQPWPRPSYSNTMQG